MKKSSTLQELLIGIGLCGICLQLLCLLVLERHLYHAVGLWTGIIVALGLCIHLEYSIKEGLGLGADIGIKYMKSRYFVRTAVACVVMAVVIYYDLGNPLTVLLGVMTPKVAVYIQPAVHKVREKCRGGCA